MNNKNIFISVGVLIVALVIAFFVLNDGGSNEPVATVNGEDITRSEFQTRFNQAKQVLNSQGQSGQLQGRMLDQLKGRVLDQLIGEALVLQEAKEQGFTASSSLVQKRYDQAVSQVGGEKALQQRLKKAGITKEQFKDTIRQQVMTEAFVKAQAKEGELEVTDQEVKSFYNRIASSQKNAPSLEQSKSQIRQQLKSQKLNNVRRRVISNLRKEADITTSTFSGN